MFPSFHFTLNQSASSVRLQFLVAQHSIMFTSKSKVLPFCRLLEFFFAICKYLTQFMRNSISAKEYPEHLPKCTCYAIQLHIINEYCIAMRGNCGGSKARWEIFSISDEAARSKVMSAQENFLLTSAINYILQLNEPNWSFDGRNFHGWLMAPWHSNTDFLFVEPVLILFLAGMTRCALRGFFPLSNQPTKNGKLIKLTWLNWIKPFRKGFREILITLLLKWSNGLIEHYSLLPQLLQELHVFCSLINIHQHSLYCQKLHLFINIVNIVNITNNIFFILDMLNWALNILPYSLHFTNFQPITLHFEFIEEKKKTDQIFLQKSTFLQETVHLHACN